MSRPKFSEEELQSTNEVYRQVPVFVDKESGKAFPEMPPYYHKKRPISPKENFRLALAGKKPYWIPYYGLMSSDLLQFRPRICADNVANRQVWDGGPEMDYTNTPPEVEGWFGLKWEWVPDISGASVHPGHPLITDIESWEDQIKFPNLDELDFEAMAKENEEYLSSDQQINLGIQCGLWERLMALMDVAEACMAMIDEDQQEGVKRFFDKYSDFLIDYIGRILDVCPQIDSIIIHQDWAYARSSFFSADVAREMLLPYMKKIVDYVHSRNVFYEVHCCGIAENLVPVFIEAGADMWGGQPSLNDFGAYAKKYKDKKFIFVQPPVDCTGKSDEEVDQMAKDWVEEFKDCHVVLSASSMPDGDAPVYAADQRFLDGVYKYSRLAYQDVED